MNRNFTNGIHRGIQKSGSSGFVQCFLYSLLIIDAFHVQSASGEIIIATGDQSIGTHHHNYTINNTYNIAENESSNNKSSYIGKDIIDKLSIKPPGLFPNRGNYPKDIYKVAEDSQSYPEFVVKIEDKLLPVREVSNPHGAQKSYEVYNMKQPGNTRHPIFYNGYNWSFSSPAITKKSQLQVSTEIKKIIESVLHSIDKDNVMKFSQHKIKDNIWVMDNVSYLTSKTAKKGFIPDNQDLVTYYLIHKNHGWTPSITLPVNAPDGSLIIIRSYHPKKSKVSESNLLFNSTMTIRKGDTCVFKFFGELNKWAIEYAPVRKIEYTSVRKVGAESLVIQMTSPTSSSTEVRISDNSWKKKIILPKMAGDRDKISLKSSATRTTIIDGSNVNIPGAMTLHAGEEYVFFYIKENKKWQLMKSPDTIYNMTSNIINEVLPPLTHPRTIINITDDDNITNNNILKEVKLPSQQIYGSRIIINNLSKKCMCVLVDKTRHNVVEGETVAFKVNKDGNIERETVTLDLLLLYTDSAAQEFGDTEISDHLKAGLNYANEALENSGAIIRDRAVAIKKIAAKSTWTNSMLSMLSDLEEDPEIVKLLDKFGADGVYLLSNQKIGGCGVLKMRRKLSGALVPTLAGVGTAHCPPSVFSHEINGHGMGVLHPGESRSYNQGNAIPKTIMWPSVDKNVLPYFSTPNRFEDKYGMQLGDKTKADAVGAINENAQLFSSIRKTKSSCLT